jgi:hypothetical protein
VRIERSHATLLAQVAINGGPCMLIGAMLGELRGIQAGLIAGIVLTILPTAFHAAARLVRLDGIVRACVREIGGIVAE